MEDLSVIIVSILIIIILYKVWPKKDDVAINEIKNDEYDNEFLAKGIADYQNINRCLSMIKDKEIIIVGKELQKKSERILLYLKNHQQCLPIARQFINYYQNRTAMLISQFVTLEETAIKSETSEKVVMQIKEVLRDFILAYDVQLSKIMEAQLTDMEAELKVARQVLDSEGIEKNTTVTTIEENDIGNISSQKEEQPSSWITPKAIGGVVLGVLGAVGIYKLMSNDKKRND